MTGTTFHRVAKIVGRLYDRQPADLTPETHLFDDLRGDSLAVVELVMDLEDEFNVRIEDGEYDTLVTLGDFVALIERLQARAA